MSRGRLVSALSLHRHGSKDDENRCDGDDDDARDACGVHGACGARYNLRS